MNFYSKDEELQIVTELFENDFRIPLNFQQTVKAYEPPPESSVADGPRRPFFQPKPELIRKLPNFVKNLALTTRSNYWLLNKFLYSSSWPKFGRTNLSGGYYWNWRIEINQHWAAIYQDNYFFRQDCCRLIEWSFSKVFFENCFPI